MCCERLTRLTLHGTFEDPRSAEILFGADHVLEGRHTFLPYLESFRFLVVNHDDDLPLHQAVVRFVGQRKCLRRLDLGRCPWELVAMVLPELDGLRAVRVRIGKVVESVIDALTKALSEHLVALHLCAVVADKPLVSPPMLLYPREANAGSAGILLGLLQEITFALDPPLGQYKCRCRDCEEITTKHVKRERVLEGGRQVGERSEEGRSCHS